MLRRPAVAAAFAVVLVTTLLGGCDAVHQSSSRYASGSEAPPAVTVIKGDTVYSLARRHAVSVRALIEANALRPPYHLYQGQTIYLPHMPEHTVVAGDTVSQIARAHRISMADLARVNGLDEPYLIRVGQRLKLPGPAANEQARIQVAARRPVAPPPPKPFAAHEAKPEPEPAPQPVVARPGPAAIPEPEPALAASPAGFVWPARGEVIARFGAMGKGQHNDGINIALPHGAPIHAAADGVVAYAGNELRGFGRLLLIKHGGGWMSAYAHNEEILVQRGARVRRGQVVARAGATGNVRGPQLHFELRKGATPVDPLEHLPSVKVQVKPLPLAGGGLAVVTPPVSPAAPPGPG